MATKFKPIDEARYDEMLGILPPALYLRNRFLVGECYDHRGPGGAPRFSAFFAFTPDVFERKMYGWKISFWEAEQPMTIAEFRAVTVSTIRENLAA